MAEVVYDDWPTALPGKKNRLTVCLIVRDEAERIGECLASLMMPGIGEDGQQHPLVPIYDEMIVVDTGSVDETVNMIKGTLNREARIEHFVWCDDYSAARNYAETFATGDYILWIDGDETLAEGHALIHEIVEAGELDAVRPACRDVDGLPHLRQELLRRRGYGAWQYPVHESLTCPTGTPEPGIIYQHHARLAERSPELDDRWPALRKRAQEMMDFESLSYVAREHGAAERYLECLAFAELALAQPHPEGSLDASELAVIIGNIYAQLGHPARAREAYQRAVREYDGWAEPHYALGQSYALEQRPDRAVSWLTASLVLNPVAGHLPFGEELYQHQRHTLLGQCYVLLGRYPQALAVLTEARERGAAVNGLISKVEAELRKQKRGNGLVVARG